MQSYPTPADAIHTERMGPHFLKVHLPDGPLHIFTQPDTGPAHDHPFAFTSHVLEGGYVEEVYLLLPGDGYEMTTQHRRPGTSHRVEANTIHRVIELPAGFCVTRIEPGPKVQESGFYEFRPDGVYFRYWHERDFYPIMPTPAAG